MRRCEFTYQTERGIKNMGRAGYKKLSILEAWVLQEFLSGLTVGLIAECSGYSVSVVSQNMQRVRRKLLVKSDVDLVLACVWFGFVEPGVKTLPERKAA